MSQSKLREAVTAIKTGNKTTGKQLLTEIIQTDPRNEVAWLWLSVTVNTRDQQRECLEKVLAINPENQQAQQALAKLEQADTMVKATAPINSSPPAKTPQYPTPLLAQTGSVLPAEETVYYQDKTSRQS